MAAATALSTLDIKKAVDARGQTIEPKFEFVEGVLTCVTFAQPLVYWEILVRLTICELQPSRALRERLRTALRESCGADPLRRGGAPLGYRRLEDHREHALGEPRSLFDIPLSKKASDRPSLVLLPQYYFSRTQPCLHLWTA